MASAKRVGHIGLGAMGQGIALNLAKFLREGGGAEPLLVWNRTRSKAEEVLAAGAAFAEGGVPEIARECDVVFCMPFDDASLLQIAREFFEHANSGSCFVSMPTVHPDTTREAAALAANRGVTFVACPVFGRPDAARSGALYCCLAGPADAKALLAPFLGAIGRGVLDMGEDPALASTQKLVGNFLIVGVVELMAEAMTLGEKSGLSRDQFLAFLAAFMPAPAITGYAQRMARCDFSTAGGKQGFTVAGGVKDASLVQRLASEAGVPVPVVDAALEHLRQQQQTEGAAEKDFSSLVEVLRRDSGLEP